MSLTPDRFFQGESVCTCCNKPMLVNDVGIVYSPSKEGSFLFCVRCATEMSISVAQDISKLARHDPDIAFQRYLAFNMSLAAPGYNLRRHAQALKVLAEQMETQADSLNIFGS